jgi:hypothetical protein
VFFATLKINCAQLLNLQTINNLVLQYRFGEIQPMDFLLAVSKHLKNFDEKKK